MLAPLWHPARWGVEPRRLAIRRTAQGDPTCPFGMLRGEDGIRTHDPLNANQMLYQAELQPHNKISYFRSLVSSWAGYFSATLVNLTCQTPVAIGDWGNDGIRTRLIFYQY